MGADCSHGSDLNPQTCPDFPEEAVDSGAGTPGFLRYLTLQGCWKPVDRAAVSAARSQHSSSGAGRRDSFSR